MIYAFIAGVLAVTIVLFIGHKLQKQHKQRAIKHHEQTMAIQVHRWEQLKKNASNKGIQLSIPVEEFIIDAQSN